MEKTSFQKLAEVFGFRVNTEAIETIKTNEGEMQHPDNWDEMTDEEKAAWEKENMPPKANARIDPPAAKKPEPKQNQAAEPDFSNLVKLNALITEIGGFDAYKALLLSAVDAVEVMQTNEKAERATLTETITANSEFEAGELKDMSLPVLRKMAHNLAINSTLTRDHIDYRVLGSGKVKANEKDLAVMADIFDAKTWKEG